MKPTRVSPGVLVDLPQRVSEVTSGCHLHCPAHELLVDSILQLFENILIGKHVCPEAEGPLEMSGPDSYWVGSRSLQYVVSMPDA